MRREVTLLRSFFLVAGVVHLLFGVAGAALPRWFFATVPPWPPLHVGQIQIAGVFDLALATGFLVAAGDVGRYAGIMFAVGLVAEWGHAAVRIGHIAAGDNPAADWPGPLVMLVFGGICLAGLTRRRAGVSSAGPAPATEAPREGPATTTPPARRR